MDDIEYEKLPVLDIVFVQLRWRGVLFRRLRWNAQPRFNPRPQNNASHFQKPTQTNLPNASILPFFSNPSRLPWFQTASGCVHRMVPNRRFKSGKLHKIQIAVSKGHISRRRFSFKTAQIRHPRIVDKGKAWTRLPVQNESKVQSQITTPTPSYFNAKRPLTK